MIPASLIYRHKRYLSNRVTPPNMPIASSIAAAITAPTPVMPLADAPDAERIKRARCVLVTNTSTAEFPAVGNR
jgi:hypothetical protein